MNKFLMLEFQSLPLLIFLDIKKLYQPMKYSIWKDS